MFHTLIAAWLNYFPQKSSLCYQVLDWRALRGGGCKTDWMLCSWKLLCLCWALYKEITLMTFDICTPI